MGIEKALIINYRLQLSNARPLHWSIFPSLTPPPARPDLSLGPLLHYTTHHYHNHHHHNIALFYLFICTL